MNIRFAASLVALPFVLTAVDVAGQSESKREIAEQIMIEERARPERHDEIATLIGYEVGLVAREEFREEFDISISSRLGVVSVRFKDGKLTYGIGSDPVSEARSREKNNSLPAMLGGALRFMEKKAIAGSQVDTDSDAIIFCDLVFEDDLLVESSCSETSDW